MAFRRLENIGEKIIAAAIEIGAQEGMHKTTAMKVAKAVDVSDFTVLQFYGTKQGYLDAAAKSVDLRIREKVYALVDEGHSPEELWDSLHEDLLQTPDSVLYFNRYKAEVGTDALEEPDKSEWLPKAQKLFGGQPQLSDEDYRWLWHYFLSSALTCAEKVIRHPEWGHSEGRKRTAQCLFHGIDSFFA